MNPRIVLASTSRYRRELLGRLGLEFEWQPPGTKEDLRPHELPQDRSSRLARAKAGDVAGRLPPGCWVIGSDQVADLDGETLGKPGTLERGIQQLRRCSGRSVVFHTSVCLLEAGGVACLEHLDRTVVRFRSLEEAEIRRYLERDEALDCAGSFRCESLGISLFESIDSSDPTALVGLPLIAVSGMLRRAGVPVP